MVIMYLVVLAIVTCAAAYPYFPQRFSDHFVSFLKNNPERNAFALHSYEHYKQAGTFGGRLNEEVDAGMKITHDPVVFVHGNTESALKFTDLATGWNTHIEYFLKKGYSMAELYGLSHGYRNASLGLQNRFTCEVIQGVRRHFEAVLDYTQSDKIDVVAHSMGVTIARAAIIGGTINFTDETCHLGHSLAKKIDTFVGIAGGNYGVCYCALASLQETNACSHNAFATGFCRVGDDNDEQMIAKGGVYCAQPGITCNNNYSSFLRSLNDKPVQEQRLGDFTVSTWSLEDEIIGPTNLAWGKRTSLLPYSDLTIEYGDLKHTGIKDLTARHVRELVMVHDIDVPVPLVSHHYHHRNHRYNTTHRLQPRHYEVAHAPTEEVELDE